MIDKYKEDQCNGCKMCKDICPTQAISYKTNQEGFWFPTVDYNKCIRCGKCVDNCPQLNGFKSNKEEPKVYASWSNDDNIRYISTSGGLFFELGKHVIQNGGYVIGSRYTEDYRGAYHTVASTLEELKPLVGSKYLQSDTEDIFKKTKELLKIGKHVLFVGTPCHNGALTNFLKKEYDNLIQCDFICKGISSPLAQCRYVDMLEDVYQSKVVFLKSKDKRNGWNNFGSAAKFENGQEYFSDRSSDPRAVAYHKGNLITRTACGGCKFKEFPRVSDITLGDFWGVSQDPRNPNLEQGTSVVLINSKKGIQTFNEISQQISFYEAKIEDVIPYNQALIEKSLKWGNREAFFKHINKVRFDRLVDKYKTKDSLKVK